MNVEKEKKLFEKYPKLFRGIHKPTTESLMCFGLEMSDGWYNIVDQMCSEIMMLCRVRGYRIPMVVQAKEKFGSLRFYLDSGDNEILDLIEEYSTQSTKICEYCGAPGKLRGEVWLKTLCYNCHRTQE